MVIVAVVMSMSCLWDAKHLVDGNGEDHGAKCPLEATGDIDERLTTKPAPVLVPPNFVPTYNKQQQDNMLWHHKQQQQDYMSWHHKQQQQDYMSWHHKQQQQDYMSWHHH